MFTTPIQVELKQTVQLNEKFHKLALEVWIIRCLFWDICIRISIAHPHHEKTRIEASIPLVSFLSIRGIVAVHPPAAKPLHILLPEHIFIIMAPAGDIGFFRTFVPTSPACFLQSTADLLLDHLRPRPQVQRGHHQHHLPDSSCQRRHRRRGRRGDSAKWWGPQASEGYRPGSLRYFCLPGRMIWRRGWITGLVGLLG